MKKDSAKYRILHDLLSAWDEKRWYYRNVLPQGWTASGALHHFAKGGSSAGRRIRELRLENKLDIECKFIHNDINNNPMLPHGTWAYRLNGNSHEAAKQMIFHAV